MPKQKKKQKCSCCKELNKSLGSLKPGEKKMYCLKCLDSLIDEIIEGSFNRNLSGKMKNIDLGRVTKVRSMLSVAEKKHKKLILEDFTRVIPACIIDEVMPKRMANKFWKFMGGQTMQMLERQSGVYACDLDDFLNGRDCTD